jgi:hypothetical protein
MSTFKKRFSARLNTKQLEHVKAQSKPSCYIRDLIERDLSQVVDHENT